MKMHIIMIALVKLDPDPAPSSTLTGHWMYDSICSPKRTSLSSTLLKNSVPQNVTLMRFFCPLKLKMSD